MNNINVEDSMLNIGGYSAFGLNRNLEMELI